MLPWAGFEPPIIELMAKCLNAKLATYLLRHLKLHLQAFLLLEVSNIFHYWPVVSLSDYVHKWKPFSHISKETLKTFCSTKMIITPPKYIPEI